VKAGIQISGIRREMKIYKSLFMIVSILILYIELILVILLQKLKII